MILNERECVICESEADFALVWSALADGGYLWWHGKPLDDVPTHRRGVRWALKESFPCCIATMSDEQIESALQSSTIGDTVGTSTFVVLTPLEFFGRVEGWRASQSVDDLL